MLVHTPLTVRAAELQQLYGGLTLATLSVDERLDVLLHVKWVSKEWDSSVTRELVELIDREADLLNRWGLGGCRGCRTAAGCCRLLRVLPGRDHCSQPCMWARTACACGHVGKRVIECLPPCTVPSLTTAPVCVLFVSSRGRSPKTLGGLRKRIAGLFLTCCQNPAFNPEAARLRVNAIGPNGPEAFEYVMDL